MKREKRYRSTEKAGKSLKRFRIMPYLEILLVIGFVAAFGWAMWTYGIPFLKGLSEQFIACQRPAAPTPAPTPDPTPAPTPDPRDLHAFGHADLRTAATEIVVPEYQYATDVTISGDTLIAPVGNYTPDGTAAFVRLLIYNVKTKSQSLLALPLEYTSIRFPAMNTRWIVYLDSAANGGGRLVAYRRSDGTARALKTVHTGLVKPVLYENTAFWIERTGQSRDKLFAVDLETGESATLAIYDSSPYGLSNPYVYGHTLLYVAPDGALTVLDLETGESKTIDVGVPYVHDPQMNADGIAFLDSDHAADGRVLWYDGSKTVEVVSGAVDFALGEGFIAYSRYDKNYVYYYGDGATLSATREDETAMLLAAGGKTMVWMDVTWRDKDIMEYMTVGDGI